MAEMSCSSGSAAHADPPVCGDCSDYIVQTGMCVSLHPLSKTMLFKRKKV